MKRRKYLWTGLSSCLLSCGHPMGIGAGPAPAESAVAEPAASPSREQSPSPGDVAKEAIDQAVDAAERSEQDKELDEGRHPKEMLQFFRVAPGQKVAELTAGGGYTAELLARVVGPEGRVYGHNTPFILDRFAEEPWSERLEKPVMKNVVRVDAEMERPLPPEVTDLDAVLLVLFYHDTVWFETDRAEMNRAIFRALRPGGVYGVVDHSARPEDGVSVAQSLHRIAEGVVVQEVTAAGFELSARADFLKNPDDARDWNASPSKAGERRGTSDRFVLRFVKPKDAAQAAPTAGPGTAPLSDDFTRCEGPRSPMCTKEYRPVCASVDTGVRCVRAPCPSTTQKTYSNGCMACADEKVSGFVPGPCAGDE